MQIRKIHFEELQQRSDELLEVLTDSKQNNIFLTPQWLITWWQFWGADKELYFLLAEIDHKIYGYAPLKREKRSVPPLGKLFQLSLINNEVAADHLDWVCLPGYEEEVTRRFYQYLSEHQNDWDILCLEDLPEESLCRQQADQLAQESFSVFKHPGQLCPYLPLERDWDSYLASKSKNFRQQTRAKRRRVENKLNARLVICDSPQQREAALKRLAELNPQRWNQKGESSSFSATAFQSFHQQIAEQFATLGWLDLAYLEHEDQIIAIIYNYRYAHKTYYYNTAFDDNFSRFSVGRVLMGYSIERAFQAGLQEFDFLRGVHGYKYEWSDLQRQNHDLLIIKKNLRAQYWYQQKRLIQGLRKNAKRYLPESLKQRIKSLLRKFQ